MCATINSLPPEISSEVISHLTHAQDIIHYANAVNVDPRYHRIRRLLADQSALDLIALHRWHVRELTISFTDLNYFRQLCIAPLIGVLCVDVFLWCRTLAYHGGTDVLNEDLCDEFNLHNMPWNEISRQVPIRLIGDTLSDGRSAFGTKFLEYRFIRQCTRASVLPFVAETTLVHMNWMYIGASIINASDPRITFQFYNEDIAPWHEERLQGINFKIVPRPRRQFVVIGAGRPRSGHFYESYTPDQIISDIEFSDPPYDLYDCESISFDLFGIFTVTFYNACITRYAPHMRVRLGKILPKNIFPRGRVITGPVRSLYIWAADAELVPQYITMLGFTPTMLILWEYNEVMVRRLQSMVPNVFVPLNEYRYLYESSDSD